MPLEPPVITIDLGCRMLVSALSRAVPARGLCAPDPCSCSPRLVAVRAGQYIWARPRRGQGGNPRRGMDAKVTGRSKAVHSMTGFARRDGGDAAVSWTWEIKSVNGRSLDVRARLPQGYESLDPAVRSAVAAACSRGNVQENLAMKRGRAPLQLQVNEELLQDR